MTRLIWDRMRDRSMRSGVDQGVLYLESGTGVAWNGLVNVKESANDHDVRVGYIDGEMYHQDRSVEGFAGYILALTYPDDLNEEYSHGMCYRVQKDLGYELHILYNIFLWARESPYKTRTALPNVEPFAWNVSTVPIQMEGLKACSHLVIDSTRAYPWVMELIEDILYGSDTSEPRLALPGEVLELFDVNALFRVVDNGDGTWTATGPDSMIQMLDSTTFEITTPSAKFLDEDTYTIGSW